MSSRRNSESETGDSGATELKVPETDAREWLTQRISLGVELAGNEPRSWDEPEQLEHNIDRWRKTNQTWLDRNIGGEAADDYKAASVHWNIYSSPDPTVRLNTWRKEIGRELASLQSIDDRLHFWLPQSAADEQGFCGCYHSS